MPEGFRIAQGWVSIDVHLDERQADEMGAKAAERVAKQIEDSPELKKAAEDAGKKTGETLGEEAAKGADEKLKQSKEKFKQTGGDTGRESGKKFGDEFAVAAALGVMGSDVFKGKQLQGAGSFSNVILGDTERLGRDVEKEGVKLGEHVSAGFLSRLGTRLRGSGNNDGLISTITNVLGQGGSKLIEGLSNIPWAGVIFKPISSAMQAMPPEFQAAIAGGIAAAILAGAAFIGAALNAVLIAGIGLGGITAGIIGQISNPIVHDTFTRLGHDFVTEFQQSTAGFEKPLVMAAGFFNGALKAIMPGLTEDFNKLGVWVPPLADGLSRLIQNIMPGLSKAFDAAGPILLTLAQELPGLGSAISDMFSSMAGGEQGAIEGLRTLMLLIDTALRMTGQMLEGLSKTFQFLVAAGDDVSGVFKTITDWLPTSWGWLNKYAEAVHSIFHEIRYGSDSAANSTSNFGEVFAKSLVKIGFGTQLASEDFSNLMKQINATRETVDVAAGAMADKMFNSLMGMDQATLGVFESQTKLGDVLKRNGLAIDRHSGQVALNTVKGQQNREAILAQVSANIKMYDTQIAAGMSAQDATVAYEQNTQALRDQLHAAGLTGKQIDGLIGKYGSVPRNVDTSIAMNGLADAINGLADLMRQINGIKRNVVIDIWQNVHTNGPADFANSHGQRYGGVVYAADGLVSGVMPEQDPPAVFFAEKGTGGEVFAPLRGISQDRAMGLGQTLGDAYGFDVAPRTQAPAAIAPVSATSPQGGGHATYTIPVQVGDRTLTTIILETLRGEPVAVSQIASEGDRRRGGNIPGFRPAGR